ncbi:MAG TPA: hypothetical protein ENN11_04725 [Methanomicrobia archaeon]|nr:hypothetical protein [Methanomicrobia archaeon]
MNERKAVGILLIIMFIFIFAYRLMQGGGKLSEDYLDIFVVGFFLVLIFLWQFISPAQKRKKDEEEGNELESE